MQVLRDAGDLAKGDQKGRKGGTKGNLELCFWKFYMKIVFSNYIKKKKRRFPPSGSYIDV